MSDVRWLHSTEAAVLAGVQTATWAHAARDPQSAVPQADKRCQACGRWVWSDRAVKRYLRSKVNGATARKAEAAANHEAITRLADGLRTERDIADELGVHIRTVKRHLSGTCACPVA